MSLFLQWSGIESNTLFQQFGEHQNHLTSKVKIKHSLVYIQVYKVRPDDPKLGWSAASPLLCIMWVKIYVLSLLRVPLFQLHTSSHCNLFCLIPLSHTLTPRWYIPWFQGPSNHVRIWHGHEWVPRETTKGVLQLIIKCCQDMRLLNKKKAKPSFPFPFP